MKIRIMSSFEQNDVYDVEEEILEWNVDGQGVLCGKFDPHKIENIEERKKYEKMKIKGLDYVVFIALASKLDLSLREEKRNAARV